MKAVLYNINKYFIKIKKKQINILKIQKNIFDNIYKRKKCINSYRTWPIFQNMYS